MNTLLGLFYNSLKKEDRNYILIMADYIDEHFDKHPEKEVYLKRLRNEKKPKFQTLIDVIFKLGTRFERKYLARVLSVTVKLIKKNAHIVLTKNLTSKEFRKRINRIPRNMISMIAPIANRKSINYINKRVSFNMLYYHQILIRDLLKPLYE
jgi:hypothetical protein